MTNNLGISRSSWLKENDGTHEFILGGKKLMKLANNARMVRPTMSKQKAYATLMHLCRTCSNIIMSFGVVHFYTYFSSSLKLAQNSTGSSAAPEDRSGVISGEYPLQVVDGA